MDMQAQIIDGLKKTFQFKKTGGAWMQEGECPDCGKRSIYCAADDPKMVKCGKENNCGYSDTVRNIMPDLFNDWSKRFEATEADPNAAADAYLSHERGIDLKGLRGHYKQELFKDYKTNATSATVRFPLGEGTYWERLIDKPDRFEMKANFEKGGKWKGHCWLHPDDDFEALAQMDEIWIEEGIFDALAMRQAFHGRDIKRGSVSAMSVNVFPEIFFKKLLAAVAAGKSKKHRPKIIIAYDVGPAGVKYAKRHLEQLENEGWKVKAAQVSPDGEGAKLDWNDLWLRHRDWKGEPEKAPLSERAIEGFLYNGAITVAKTARIKAALIQARTALRSFEFRHGNRIWWAKSATSEDDDSNRLFVQEIATCAFRVIYEERDDVKDETFYFLEIDYPNKRKKKVARFSHAATSSNSDFKKRLMAFAGIWMGTGEQLDRMMSNQIRSLKTVEPVDFTGYSADHKAWLFGDLAVHKGRVVKINSHKYFDLGKVAVKRRSDQNLLKINYHADSIKFDWLDDVWTAWGPQGLIAFAFFAMSTFAVQIRRKQKSLGFLEITGEGGSGKTTLIAALWQAFGRFEHEGIDPNKGTVSYLARSMMGVSNLPVGLVEGNREDDKKNHNKKFDWNELLTLYNGRNPRGTALKTSGNEISEPPFLGSIYLMQNDPISAIPPVLERCMTMVISKADWTEQTGEAAVRIETMPMEEMSGTIIHIVKQESKFLPYFFERFDHHNKDMKARVDGLINSRCIKCHSQLAAGVEALAKMFPIKADRIKETLKFVDQMAIKRQMTAGGDHPKVAEFWEKVDFIIRGEDSARHGKGTSLNMHRDPDNIVAINLPNFERAVKQAGMQPMDMDQLKRLLRGSQSRKFIDCKNVNPPEGKVAACWIFEQPKPDIKDKRII